MAASPCLEIPPLRCLVFWLSGPRPGFVEKKLDHEDGALKRRGLLIFREKVSGAYRDRPELNRMPDQLRKGAVVTFWKLDRLARSTRNLLKIVETIGNAGARFQSISEPLG